VHRVATTILVDSSGRLLLQLGDGSTTKDPHRWGPTRRAGRAGGAPARCGGPGAGGRDRAAGRPAEALLVRARPLGYGVPFLLGPTTASQEDVLC